MSAVLAAEKAVNTTLTPKNKPLAPSFQCSSLQLSRPHCTPFQNEQQPKELPRAFEPAYPQAVHPIFTLTHIFLASKPGTVFTSSHKLRLSLRAGQGVLGHGLSNDITHHKCGGRDYSPLLCCIFAFEKVIYFNQKNCFKKV